jgi:cholesterol transport system auxiliary component
VRGKSSNAVISIDFALVSSQTGKLIKSKRFSYMEATPTVDAEGYVAASNNAIERLSKDLLAWLR